MNNELHKAIEKATRVQVLNDGFCHDTVDVVEHEAAQAKLLRVIELLVEQRNYRLRMASYNQNQIDKEDAELIAALADVER